MDSATEPVALHEAARVRYLNYALSVITARALPDVRDGLKPVQRRILYAMFQNLKLTPDGRYRKSAAVVGEVMAKYHPHGDSSIYDAMVRLAQPFSLLHTLVDGQGNFGSIDGDSAAAMRYTECKLTPLAVELLDELKQETVDFRPNYDGQHQEPVVLPAQFPQLLVNGAEGIAVGMATRIPPHNLREVIDATVALIETPDASTAQIARRLKGPDFPTGGVLLNTRDEIREIYETGQGTIRMQGTWQTEQKGRKHHIIITSIPYGLVKATLVEKIGQMVGQKKVPQIVDVRDESTDEVRVVLELRKSEDAEAAMAFLYKHTALRTSYPVNLTCLVPTANPEVGAPLRADVKTILRAWLDFRYATVKRRFEYELRQLRERIHILEGFEKVFDALDEAIRIIRKSEGKRDAAEKLMDRFKLDDLQADAILELRLYRLAKLEILSIRDELHEKRSEAERIEAILASEREMWGTITHELQELKKLYGRPRTTEVGGEEAAQIVEYDESAYIVAENTWVMLTRDGWIKRQGSFTTVDKIRTREGDEVGWIARASTRSTLTVFGSAGAAYSMRVDQVPSSTGYGEPVQAHFAFADGERVVGLALHDEQALPKIRDDVRDLYNDENPGPPHGIAVTRSGRVVRFPLTLHQEPSTKNGRRYMKPDDAPDAVLACYVSDGTEHVTVASEQGRALTYGVWEVNVVKGAGKGVTAIKLRDDDHVFGFALTLTPDDGAVVTTPQGREEIVRPAKYAATRGGKGAVVMKRDRFVAWKKPLVVMARAQPAQTALPLSDPPAGTPTPADDEPSES